MPIFCCYARRRRASPVAKSSEQRRQNIFGIRSVRMDESKRLMVMPGGNDQTLSSRRHYISANISRSPPPPRCLTNGKTMIVPLNSGKGRALFPPLLATPDNIGTTFENDITKGCNTIVENNENTTTSLKLDKSDADFISIDRTIASYIEPRQQKLQQCKCGISIQDKAPRFELPTPSYAPPPLPILLAHSPWLNRRKELLAITETDNNSVSNSNDVKVKTSSSSNSMNSLGSPQDSSFNTESPLDTSASISDSFCVTSEEEMNLAEKGRVYFLEKGVQQRTDFEIYRYSPEFDCSIPQSDLQQKYILHQIDEESEETANIKTSAMVISQTLDSIKSILLHSDQKDSQQNIIIPHSISQQFELLNYCECPR